MIICDRECYRNIVSKYITELLLKNINEEEYRRPVLMVMCFLIIIIFLKVLFDPIHTSYSNNRATGAKEIADPIYPVSGVSRIRGLMIIHDKILCCSFIDCFN